MKLFPLVFLFVAGCAGLFGPTGEKRFLTAWVKEVDTPTGLIMVKTPGGDEGTLFLDEEVEVSGQDKSSVEDLKAGDIILVTFEIPSDSPDQLLMREIEVIGYRASFCDCGFRCVRSTGEAEMEVLRSGMVGVFSPSDFPLCSCSSSWWRPAAARCGCPLSWGCRCAGGRIRY